MRKRVRRMGRSQVLPPRLLLLALGAMLALGVCSVRAQSDSAGAPLPRFHPAISNAHLITENPGEFKKWDVGDIVAATGTLIKTKTGELSVAAHELRLLAKSLRPMPEKWHGISDQELKLRQRYLDLIVSEETRQVFRMRTELTRFIRSFLDALDFTEVETPMMHPIPGGAAAKPFETYHQALSKVLYLRIAPELYLKRLIVGGMERVYELNRAFRNEGLSTRHNPEFTILEVYQAFARYEDVMDLTENLIREAARALLGTTTVSYQDESYELAGEFPRRRLEQSLIDRITDLDPDSVRSVSRLTRLCREHEIEVHTDCGAGKMQLELFEKLVEPTLKGPVFITQYPAEVSPLARRSDADEFLTDRFELFIGGREFANGFSELNDPEDQAERFRAQLKAKERGDDPSSEHALELARRAEALVAEFTGGARRHQHLSLPAIHLAFGRCYENLNGTH